MKTWKQTILLVIGLLVIGLNLFGLGVIGYHESKTWIPKTLGFLVVSAGTLMVVSLIDKARKPENDTPQGSNRIKIPKEMVHLVKINCIYNDIQAEIIRAQAKFPQWPTDPVRAAAVVSEEAGELVKAVNELCDEPHKTSLEEVRDEAVQTAAMAIRFLQSLDRYEFKPSEQHEQ